MSRYRALLAGSLSIALLVVLAGPAVAGGGGRVDPISGEVQDQTSSPLNVATGTPKHGCPQTSCTGSTSTTPSPVDSGSGQLWFWDAPASFRFPAPFATTGGAGTGVVSSTWSYPQMAGAASCAGPLTGSAGSMPVLGVPTSRNIAASFSWVEYGSNDTYSWLDMTIPTKPVIKQATFGSSDYNFVWGCKSYIPPPLKTATCAKFGQYQLMGPYDRSGTAMVAASAGGSNTRRDANGNETVTGKLTPGSSVLGDTIAPLPTQPASPAVMATYVQKLSTTPASQQNVYDLCLATETDLSMQARDSEEIDSYGRYYADSQIWRDQVRYYVFNSYGSSTSVLSHLWPSIYGTASWHLAGRGYLPVYIDSVTPLARADSRAFYAIHCVKNTTANAVTRDTVPAGGGWAGGNWNAVEGSDDQFYAYQCSGGSPTPTRDDDLLSCDRFGTPTYRPYQFQTAPYTYHQAVVSTYQEVVTDWCGIYVENGEIKVWCATHEETRSVYGAVRDATPAGFSDTGTNWTRKLSPPNGYVDDGTQYVSYAYSDVIEDRKYASPIASGLPNRFAADGIYDANMTGDRYRFQWKLPRINLTSTGQDVTKIAGSDVRWRARFKLEDASSPIVIRDPQTGGAPSGGKNDSGQAYHLFLDTTPATSNDNPGPFLSWSPLSGAWSGSTPSVPVDRWSPAQPGSWLDQARTLWVRFFASSTAGKGWKLTPWWEVTVTVPITSTSPTISSITSDGDWILGTSTSKTETRRQTYECPGQSLRVVVDGVTSGTLGEYQALGGSH